MERDVAKDVAKAVAPAAVIVAGRAAGFAPYLLGSKALSVALGPVGWVLAGIWAVSTLAQKGDR